MAGQVGWGLFSIRERLTLLNGRFEIDSSPGTGTRVRLVAPRHAEVSVDSPPAPPRATTREPSAAAIRAASTDRLRILVVDDHAGVRSAIGELLNERPQLSVVGAAADGIEAITQAHALQPDVILMDIAMPGMDGIEATRRIRAELPEIRILGLSMQPRSVAAPAIEEAGAHGFFVKGTDTQRLIEHLLLVQASRAAGNAATS
jgi:CheY-like chemotaxis protein